MEANQYDTFYMVKVANEDVVSFASKWPACNLDQDAEYIFEFSSNNGDLINIEKTVDGLSVNLQENENDSALLTLSEDAGLFGANDLGLTEVLSMKYNLSALTL